MLQDIDAKFENLQSVSNTLDEIKIDVIKATDNVDTAVKLYKQYSNLKEEAAQKHKDALNLRQEMVRLCNSASKEKEDLDQKVNILMNKLSTAVKEGDDSNVSPKYI